MRFIRKILQEVDSMKEQINNLLKKQLTHLELYMKNGREIILHKPNEEGSNSSIRLEEDYAIVKVIFDNGCVNEQVVPYRAISYLNGMYDCPELTSTGE